MKKLNKAEILNEVAKCYHFDPHWLNVIVEDLFATDSFSGKRVLDIGAGRGFHSCVMGALGASEVVALEPEGDGSRPEGSRTFEENIEKLKLDNVTLIKKPLEDFQAEEQSFDYILMYSVINHLDEERVEDLDINEESFQFYLLMVQQMLNWLKPGGKLIVHDAARSHAFAPLIKMGILKRNPRYPTIEWEKHQDPEVWRRLFKNAGFVDVKSHWGVYTRYDFIRKIVGWSSFINWFINPHFIIHASRR